MQILFKEITSGDIDAVRKRLARDPGSVALVATPPPKKHAGQSPLMIALKTGRFGIAMLLLDHGADVNFIDSDGPHPHSMPVLHDAIKAAVMRSRWLRPTRFTDDEQWALRNTVESSDAAFTVLRRVLESGADVHALDSHGNSALHRAAMDARQILPMHRYSAPEWVDPKPLNPELVEDLTRIFDLLLAHGADPGRAEKQLGRSVAEHYRSEPVGRFLRADPAL
ncbi:hypothetical protein ABZZ04_16595 [Streptomyces sp. NPDC006435]|uniref:ankyrin repeat domain-containing protein n=1 Tax=Streptomyces sp. NPDC006435 TaxID=3154300 RepID=UPI0033A73F17